MSFKLLKMLKLIYIYLFLQFITFNALSLEQYSQETFISEQNLPCHKKTDECYDQLYNYFLNFQSDNTSQVATISDPVRLIGQSSVRLHNRRTPFVALSVHGLFENAKQMGRTSEAIFSHMHYNSISITLPGHSINPHRYVIETSHHEWISSFESAFRVASLLGDKVILIGQSTGALLSAYGARRFSSDVGGLILIEPAFELNTGPELLSCLVGRFIKDSDNIKPVLNYMNIPKYYKHLNLFLGCEVSKMINTIFNPKNKIGPIDKDIFSFVHQIKSPTLFINNINDDVVSGNFNKDVSLYFSGNVDYIEINQDRLTPHGSFMNSSLYMESYLNLLKSFLNQYIKNSETSPHVSYLTIKEHF